MEKIKKFFECLIPISNCNLKCSYCYVIQENRRDSGNVPFKLPPKEIARAFSKKRIGGTALINLCGFGETMIVKELPEIIMYLLREGHFVNVTNNGTITKNLEKTISLSKEYCNHLSFSFSLHYVELKNKKLLDVFARNVRMVKNAGCSVVLQLNLCDEYIDIVDEIKTYCLEEFGYLPQVALTRKENKFDYEIMTNYGEKRYVEVARQFESSLFEFTYQNFNKKRKEFCYAGDWSFKVDLATGDLKSCNFSKPHFNLYDDINAPIKKSTIGHCCLSDYCVNSSHYLSLGDIPELKTPSYAALRKRNNNYVPEMEQFLSQKLKENNQEYSFKQKISTDVSQFIIQLPKRGKRVIKKIFRGKLV